MAENIGRLLNDLLNDEENIRRLNAECSLIQSTSHGSQFITDKELDAIAKHLNPNYNPSERKYN